MDAQNAARIFAKQKGDTILEMTPHGQALEEWTKNLDWETEAKPLWQKTSKDFAGSTVGEAHVFIYEPKYRGANSVWEQDELPILVLRDLVWINMPYPALSGTKFVSL